MHTDLQNCNALSRPHYRWCKFAKKAMTLRRSGGGGHNEAGGSPHLSSFSAFNSPMPTHQGFSTRTRLRPGGPPINTQPPLDNPKTHSTLRNGSLEEIGMRTMHPGGSQNNQFLLNRRPYFSTMMKSTANNHLNHPSTPLVKQKTAGCSSPRVQMYRTRVVYSDARDAIKAAQEAAV